MEMENSNHKIDQIIRNKLIDYEEDVSSDFWTRLSARLSKRKIINGLSLGFFILSGFVFWMMIPEMETKLIADNEAVVTHNYTENHIINEPDNKSTITTETFALLNNNTRKGIAQAIIIQDKPKTDKATFIQDNLVGKKPNNGLKYENNLPLNYLGAKASSISLSKNENKVLLTRKDENFRMKDVASGKGGFSRFSISLEAGFGTTWKYLKSDPQHKELVNFRNENEFSVTNPVYGITFNYHYKNWIIVTGLEYTSLGEKLNYHIKETVIDPEGGYYRFDTLWLDIYDHGNFIPTAVGSDATWVDEYNDINHLITNANRYSYIEIPLKVGYKFHSQKFAFYPSVGTSIGLLNSSKGRLPEQNTSNFAEVNKTNGYLKPITTNFIFELGFEYKVAPNYGLYITPFYRKGINSLYKDYPLKGSYHSAGLKFGVNIYL